MSDKDIDKLFIEAESKLVQELKADNLKLLKSLEKAKNKKADMIEAVYEAVSTNLRTWTNQISLNLNYINVIRTKK